MKLIVIMLSTLEPEMIPCRTININILVIMLPTLEPEMIPGRTVPLLVFVNVKSGGCQVCIFFKKIKCNFFYYF